MTDTTTPVAPAGDPTPAPAAAPSPAPAEPTPQAPAPAAAAPAPAPAAADPAPAAPQGAPEAYEAFTLPEGANMDDTGLTAFGEFARELNLPQDAAQAMLNKLAPAMAQRQAEQIESAKAQWKADLQADKDLGKPENRAIAKTAMDKFGSPELHQLLEGSGLIDHPEIVRAFFNAGKAISPDTVFTGRQTQQAGPTVAQRLYPNMNP